MSGYFARRVESIHFILDAQETTKNPHLKRKFRSLRRRICTTIAQMNRALLFHQNQRVAGEEVTILR